MPDRLSRRNERLCHHRRCWMKAESGGGVILPARWHGANRKLSVPWGLVGRLETYVAGGRRAERRFEPGRGGSDCRGWRHGFAKSPAGLGLVLRSFSCRICHERTVWYFLWSASEVMMTSLPEKEKR